MSFSFAFAKNIINYGLNMARCRPLATSLPGLSLQTPSLGGALSSFLKPKNARCLHLSSAHGSQQSEAWLRKIDERTMINNGRYNPKPRKPSKMFGRPQIKGVVLRLLVKKPKKPNSANRRCAKVRLSNGKIIIAHIPGEGHSLTEHNVVLVRGGKVSDLTGVHHKIMRGKLDCAPVVKKTAG